MGWLVSVMRVRAAAAAWMALLVCAAAAGLAEAGRRYKSTCETIPAEIHITKGKKERARD